MFFESHFLTLIESHTKYTQRNTRKKKKLTVRVLVCVEKSALSIACVHKVVCILNETSFILVELKDRKRTLIIFLVQANREIKKFFISKRQLQRSRRKQ